MPHLPCLYNAICVDLVPQAVKKHSLGLLSSLNISVVTRTYFGKSVRKELGEFVCSFAIPFNSLFFFSLFFRMVVIIYCFKLTYAAKFCMHCAIPLFLGFFYLKE